MATSKTPHALLPTSLGCIVLFGVSIAVLSASVNEAEAQSRASICRSLNSQLASLSSGGSSGGNSAKYRKFNNAVRSQETQVKKTKRIARRGRCTGLGFLNSKSAQCKRVISSLKKMEVNLRKLKRSRDKFAPKQVGSARKRSQILRRMKQNRCNAKTIRTAKAQQPIKKKRKTLVEQIFGVKTYSDTGQRKKTVVNKNSGQKVQKRVRITNVGTYRTLCVRKTDGYYFPISFSTVKDRFESDQAVCQAMCPKNEVELYHHKMPSEDSEDMINYRTGKAYAEEAFAFAYRKTVDLEQKCRFATETGSIQFVTVNKSGNINSDSERIGTPVFREDPSLSPDDHDIKNGKITLAKAKGYLINSRTQHPTEENQVFAENRKVRIVGPAFFPVQ